jgi:hypothetical protein
MRGPHERLKYDLRRVWECPVCKRRERTAGTVTFRHCNCRMKQVDGQPVVMKLVEDGVQRVGRAILAQRDPLQTHEAMDTDRRDEPTAPQSSPQP